VTHTKYGMTTSAMHSNLQHSRGLRCNRMPK